MIGRSAVSVAILLAAAAPRVSAQRLTAHFPTVVAPSPASRGGFLGPSDRDHRYTGFYVGLGAGAALGIYAVAECSGNTECAVRPVPFALLSVVVFSITGALIGGVFPK